MFINQNNLVKMVTLWGLLRGIVTKQFSVSKLIQHGSACVVKCARK